MDRSLAIDPTGCHFIVTCLPSGLDDSPLCSPLLGCDGRRSSPHHLQVRLFQLPRGQQCVPKVPQGLAVPRAVVHCSGEGFYGEREQAVRNPKILGETGIRQKAISMAAPWRVFHHKLGESEAETCHTQQVQSCVYVFIYISIVHDLFHPPPLTC